MHHRAQYALVAAASLFVAIPQQPGAPRKLGAPTAALEQEFTTIDGVFELRDGRVVVLDSRENFIHLIDLKSGASAKIGREGDGPGEYRRPVEIWPASGDSALIRDFGRFAQLMVITPTGEVGGFVSMVDSALSKRNFNPTFVDRAGRIYALEYTPDGGVWDSARVVRWDRRRGVRDTVTRYKATLTPSEKPSEADVVRDRDGRIMGYRPAAVPKLFQPYNDWAAAPDGRVAIVRAAPYQVSLVALNGNRTTGPVVPVVPVSVTQAEKDEYIAERKRPGLSMSSRNGVTTTQYVTPRPMGDVEWPDAYPPFVFRSSRFASDGMLWVRRHTRAGAPILYDVFDQAAKLSYQLELPAKRKVVGFGNGVVYLARVDDDDLHYLERYKLIPTRTVAP
jgi:hypothetical protein